MFLIVFTIVSPAAEWKKDANGWWYEHDDGSYMKSGWETIDGKEYCFNSDGYMYSNAVTPDGSVVAPSGEKIIPGAAYKDIYAQNEYLGISLYTELYDYDDKKKSEIIDRGAYYEVTNASFLTVKRFYMDMTGKQVGDIIRLNNIDFRIISVGDSNNTGFEYWGIEGADIHNSDAAGWYWIYKIGNHYELKTDNDYSMCESLYDGSVYLAKDCKINTFFSNDAQGLYQELLPIQEYLKEVPDTNTCGRYFPIMYLCGGIQMEQNGLITTINQAYMP